MTRRQGLLSTLILEGLYITNLSEDKIAVTDDVREEMRKLRTERKLRLCVTPVHKAGEIPFILCYLNTQSLHKQIDDIYRHFNYTSTDVNVFAETRFCTLDTNDMYNINGDTLFRNDGTSNANNIRPYGGTAVYSHRLLSWLSLL